MITFIHPLAFLWLLLAIPLVLFYLWKTRRPQTQVVTGALWQKAIPILHPRRAWQKQRRFVSLLVQMGILLILTTAMAEPCWRRPQRVVLVLDATSSMNVKNSDGISRFEEAKEHARKLTENMGYVDSLAVIVVGEKIRLHSRMSHDRKQILASFDKLPQTGGAAPVDEAVAMARSLVTAGTNGKFDPKTNHVILISDGCFPLANRVLKDDAVRWIPVGNSIGNVLLETLRAERRTPEKPENAEIFVALRNFSEKPVSGTLTVSWKTASAKESESPKESTSANESTSPKESESLSSDSRNVQIQIPALKDGGLLTRTIPITSPNALNVQAVFHAAEEGQDALTDDNSGAAFLHEAFAYRVTVVAPQEPNVLLENALRTLPGTKIESKVLKKGFRLATASLKESDLETVSTDESGIKIFNILIFDRTLPSKEILTKLADGTIKANCLFFSPPADSPFWKRSETVRDYVLMPWLDGLHSGISTAGVGFPGTHALTPFPETVSSVPWLFSQSALEINQNQNVSEENENFAKQARTVEMTELTWGLNLLNKSDQKSRFVLSACDLTQSDWILADDFPRFLQYAFDWMIHTPASEYRLEKGLENYWDPKDSFADSDLNVPEAPEKIFVFPGEDVVPMWTILILIVCGIFTAEWYFYQRRWIE